MCTRRRGLRGGASQLTGKPARRAAAKVVAARAARRSRTRASRWRNEDVTPAKNRATASMMVVATYPFAISPAWRLSSAAYRACAVAWV